MSEKILTHDIFTGNSFLNLDISYTMELLQFIEVFNHTGKTTESQYIEMLCQII